MKVLALNGSPRMKTSSTYHMLKPLLEGMEEAGAQTELIHIREYDLENCTGCYTCWVHTPGECVNKNKDSMYDILQKFYTTDLVVFGTPLYIFTMSGIMKTFLDRTIPGLEPWLIPNPHLSSTTMHPERFHKPEKMLLVSPCGFPEFENFDSLVTTFKQIARMFGWDYVGEILRPAAEPLSRKEFQSGFAIYFNLLRQVGKQVIRDGKISNALQTELRKDLFPGGKEGFYKIAEGYWTRDMDRFKVPEGKRHTVPVEAGNASTSLSEQTLREFVISKPGESGSKNPELDMIMMGMPTTFNPKVAGDLDAILQYKFSGEGGGIYHLRIKDGECTAHRGPAVSADDSTLLVPNLIVKSTPEVWVAISRGEIDGMQAFLDAKYHVTGDMKIMMILDNLFDKIDDRKLPVTSVHPSNNKEETPMIDKSTLNCHDIIAGMPEVFDAEAAGELTANIQFDVSGKEPGSYNLHIESGTCSFLEGEADSPSLTIHTPSEVWLAVSRGEIDGQAALMQGKYTVDGDFNLLLKLNEMFL
jgi:putative sterol carrier protein/Pyruvate/2-oxoacid:ferredoxin oxidoreductase delta subunit